jgi:hypothetical protein
MRLGKMRELGGRGLSVLDSNGEEQHEDLA